MEQNGLKKKIMKSGGDIMTNTNKGRAKSYFTRIHPDAIIPTYGTPQSSGCDLYLLEDTFIPPRQVVLARTGIVVKPPMGYWYELCLRSSTPIKNPGLVQVNGVGVLDFDFCGPADEIKIPLLNVLSEDSYYLNAITLKKHSRIAQLILRPLLQPDICEMPLEELQESNRATRGGFGTTGD